MEGRLVVGLLSKWIGNQKISLVLRLRASSCPVLCKYW